MTLFTLQGKRGLVVGIANANSIAYGCATAFREMGADLAVTYLNRKAEPHVRPLAESLGAASGIDRFDELLARTAERAPTHHLVTVEDIGPCAAFLASDAARQLTESHSISTAVITLSVKNGAATHRGGTGRPLAIALAILVLLAMPTLPSALAQVATDTPVDPVDTLLRAFPDGLRPDQAMPCSA